MASRFDIKQYYMLYETNSSTIDLYIYWLNIISQMISIFALILYFFTKAAQTSLGNICTTQCVI
jgi:hypothetical protein